MAKISELVKTYKLLNDPNAPDWNVRFVGGAVIALAVIAAAGALLWNAGQDEAGAPPAAAIAEPAPEEGPCSAAKEPAPLPDGVNADAAPCIPTLP